VRTNKLLYTLLALFGLLLAACSPAAKSVDQPAQPAATTAAPAEKGAEATATPASTETLMPPTATPIPPTSTTIPPTATPVPPPTKEPQQAGTLQGSGPCYNPYFPVIEGVVWRYRNVSPVSETLVYSVTYSDVSAIGFTAHQSYPTVQTETQWTCSESGLVSAQLAQIALGQLPDIEIESVEFTGVTLPPATEWKVGLTWDSAYKFTGKMTLEGLGPVAATYDLTAQNKIVSVDAVSVPAGDYDDAMRVDSHSKMVIHAKAGETALPPITFEFDNTNWHVKDVGLVKSEMVDQAGDFTTELLSME
jgi:hypothetical protein